MRFPLTVRLITLLTLLATFFVMVPAGFCQTYQSDKTRIVRKTTAGEILILTPQEKSFLARKKVIKMCIDPNWMPLEMIKNGKHIGMTAEYIAIIAKMIGTPIQMVPTHDWSESIAFAKARKCDIFSLAMPTPERRTYMNFTRPYLSIPLVMAARTETPFIDNISLITDKKIGLVKGYAFNEILRKRFPKMQIVDVASAPEGLKQVVSAKLFGFIGTLATVGYTIQKDFVGELKVAGKFDERWELGIGVRNDEPVLVTIFDKAIAAIDSKTHQQILNNWIAVRYDHKGNQKLIIQILLLATVALLILLWHNYTLRKYNRKLHEQNVKIQQQAEKLHLTEKKLRLQQKMEAVGLMAGGVAHDLNNILSGIISYPELILLKLPADSPLRRPVTAILDSGKRAADVVADMLTITRGVAAVKDKVTINQEIENAINSPEVSTLNGHHQEITLTTELAPELRNIEGSSVHIRRVLTNLIMNAFEAISGPGEIIITSCNLNIDTPDMEGYLAKPGEYIAITIQDNGPGISATDQARIFEPFYSKKNMGRSGTGLGLAIVWNIIEDHEGKIKLKSDTTGTTFTIYLPAAEASSDKTEPASEPDTDATVTGLYGNSEKILIVDDETIQRDIASELLTSLNYQTLTAASGEEGIERLRKEHIDLVLLDMLMEPGINGRQTYAYMSEIKPGLKAVIASGFSENSEVEKALVYGPSAFIKKPYTIQCLGEIVKRMLKKDSA